MGALKVIKSDGDEAKHDHYWLRAQFAKLKGKGVIRRDKDVADATGYHKGSISVYLNPDKGVPVSRFFVAKFLEIYGRHLNEPQGLEEENILLKARIRELEESLEESRMLNKLLQGK